MPTTSKKRLFSSAVFIALAALGTSAHSVASEKPPWVGETLEGETCVGKQIGFGPFDYRVRARFPAELSVVENAHFTPEVERLEFGNTASPINDIAYTIMAWPNHHRALHSAMRFRMMNWNWPDDVQAPPAECQLQRAIAFSPEDSVPYMMYGTLLHKAEQYDKALLAFRQALKLTPDDPLTQYNLGLTLTELEQYEEATEMAKAAYAAGIPFPGLQKKLAAAKQAQKISAASGTAKPAPTVTLEKDEDTDSAEDQD